VIARALPLLAVLAATAGARAQATRDARELFEEGTSAVHDGRFADARRLLEQSLSAAPRAATAFNLVVALRGMGEVVSAGDVCRDLLDERFGRLEQGPRGEATTLCDEVSAAVAHLTIHVSDAGEVRLDGLSLGEATPAEPIEVDVDPGAHALTLRAPGREDVDHAVEVAPGERTDLELTAPPVPAVPPPEPGPDVGLIVGLSAGGAAAIALAVVLGVVLGTQASGPRTGDYPVTMTLVF
jgi:hypothetical protein